ncbi:MAG: hypothetical protein GC162_10900 [Planctomycetes bacterium]|nr:hypothetical protein [Planctomycetota bacterium]
MPNDTYESIIRHTIQRMRIRPCRNKLMALADKDLSEVCLRLVTNVERHDELIQWVFDTHGLVMLKSSLSRFIVEFRKTAALVQDAMLVGVGLADDPADAHDADSVGRRLAAHRRRHENARRQRKGMPPLPDQDAQ